MKPAVLLLAALTLATPLFPADLPTGESLLQRCVEREGGATALARAENAIMTGTVELVGHNMSGPLAMYQQGEKAYTSIDLPGIGKIEEGFDGTVAWENNLLQGPRIKDGEELEAVKRAARVSMFSNWKDYYKSAVTAGAENVDGKPAWKIDMTPTQGGVEEFYFDRDSGLLVKMTQTLPTALGDIPVEITFGDYRIVQGVQTPFIMTQKAMSQNMAMHIDKVTYDAKLPANRFDLPAEVKAIADKKK